MQALSKTHQDLLTNLGYKDKLKAVDEAIIVNGNFLREIADTVGKNMFGDDSDEEEEDETEKAGENEDDEPHPFDVADGDDDSGVSFFSFVCSYIPI
jgi:hypothetical protein